MKLIRNNCEVVISNDDAKIEDLKGQGFVEVVEKKPAKETKKDKAE